MVSADSRQIYREFDIGTAKPTLAERALVRHHLVDCVDPDSPYSLADYQSDAYRALADITARGLTPLLVGGTGLYVRAVLDGLSIPRVPPDPELRAALEQRAAREGREVLHAELARLDPGAATSIDARNVRRVVRALEVCLLTGRPFSATGSAAPPPYRVLRIGLTASRDILYRRIDSRIDAQLAAGLVDEVRRLLAAGYLTASPAMSSLGYRELAAYLRGELSLDVAAERMKFETHRYVRQQYTWFRLDSPAIHWLDIATDVVPAALALTRAWLEAESGVPATGGAPAQVHSDHGG